MVSDIFGETAVDMIDITVISSIPFINDTINDTGNITPPNGNGKKPVDGNKTAGEDISDFKSTAVYMAIIIGIIVVILIFILFMMIKKKKGVDATEGEIKVKSIQKRTITTVRKKMALKSGKTAPELPGVGAQSPQYQQNVQAPHPQDHQTQNQVNGPQPRLPPK
jgi:hypothetical protein